MTDERETYEAPQVILEPGSVDEGTPLAEAEISPMVSVPTEPEPLGAENTEDAPDFDHANQRKQPEPEVKPAPKKKVRGKKKAAAKPEERKEVGDLPAPVANPKKVVNDTQSTSNLPKNPGAWPPATNA